MRVLSIISVLAGSLFVVASPLGDPSTDPEVIAVAVFPEENQFSRVTNGQKNKLLVGIENKSNHNITITSIAGSVHHPESGKLVKNTTALTYGIPLIQGAKISLPYSFYSEFRPGDQRLNLWVDHSSPAGKFRVQAFDSVVAIVEQTTSSWLDPATLFTLLIALGLLGGIGYMVYSAFAPPPKRVAVVVPKEKVSEPVAVTASGAGGYQEEWIPQGHLKSGAAPRASRRKSGKSGAITSGDEVTSGAESGPEKRRRK